MLLKTIVAAILVLAPMRIVLAQSPGGAQVPASNQACPQVRPISEPPALGGAKPAPDDTKLPGGAIACATSGAPLETTRTDPGSGVMVTSPTGMMTNPGLQPMPDASKLTPPK